MTHFQTVFPDPYAPRTVVVVPSLSLDPDVLANVSGAYHYEERMLCMAMLLRLPRTRLIFVTSEPVAASTIDYYLHLLPGIPSGHARRRLSLFACHDASPLPLTQKILQRPRLLQRIREHITDPGAAHLTCFNACELERTLAVQLDVPLYACDPQLAALGSKSGGREIFRAADVPMPDGFENLADEKDIAEALAALKGRNPDLRRAAVKMNDGFAGEGNAVFSYTEAPDAVDLGSWVRDRLAHSLDYEANGMSWERFSTKFRQMGGVVEAYVDGDEKRSPSVQCRIDPVGQVRLISTHDQVLGGRSGQVFLGCTFPAADAYRREIQEMGLRVGKVLRDRGALGRFGIDFVSVREPDGWRHHAIEINLRKGGTTHPYMMLQFLTDGTYDHETGMYYTPTGQPRYYYASDNLKSDAYVGLTPSDLIDISVANGLHFHGTTQQGVVFHLIGALSEFGKLGVVCVSESREGADRLYRDTVAVLDREAAGEPDPQALRALAIDP